MTLREMAEKAANDFPENYNHDGLMHPYRDEIADAIERVAKAYAMRIESTVHLAYLALVAGKCTDASEQ